MSQSLVGQRFGKLIALKEVLRIKNRRAFKFQCDCGIKCVKHLSAVVAGRTRSCGCLKRENIGDRTRTHGMSTTPTYKTWCGMRKRCYSQNSKSYADYGGRGIRVCKRWQKFVNFLADMGERPTLEHEISRINNNKGYQPGNCEWTIDGVAQTRNRRKQKYHSNRGKATSRFRGVDLWAGKLWRARIALRGKVKYLGTFRKETEAARTYDKVARLHRGFILNFPEL